MAELRVNVKGRIPRRVMEGHYPLYESVPKIFLAELIRGYIDEIYESYAARSVLGDEPNMDPKGEPVIGQADNDGNTWEQLRPKTYRTKQKHLGNNQTYLLDRLSEYAGNQAENVLARFVEQVEPISGDNINIRTGELIAAYHAPPIINGELVPGPDQVIVSHGGTHFSFSTTLEEKEATVAKFGRPIIPNQETKMLWLERSIYKAIDAAEVEFQRLLQQYGHSYRGQKRRVI